MYICPVCGESHTTTACRPANAAAGPAPLVVPAPGPSCYRHGNPHPSPSPVCGPCLSEALAKVATLELQISELKKEIEYSKEVEEIGDRMLHDANRLNVTLQNSLDKMLKMYPASTFCDVDCEEGSCEHCTLEREVKEPLKRKDSLPYPRPVSDDEAKQITRCDTCKAEIPVGHCRYTIGSIEFCGRCGVPNSR